MLSDLGSGIIVAIAVFVLLVLSVTIYYISQARSGKVLTADQYTLILWLSILVFGVILITVLWLVYSLITT